MESSIPGAEWNGWSCNGCSRYRTDLCGAANCDRVPGARWGTRPYEGNEWQRCLFCHKDAREDCSEAQCGEVDMEGDGIAAWKDGQCKRCHEEEIAPRSRQCTCSYRR